VGAEETEKTPGAHTSETLGRPPRNRSTDLEAFLGVNRMERQQQAAFSGHAAAMTTLEEMRTLAATQDAEKNAAQQQRQLEVEDERQQ
jgi:hypothetical protein